MRNRTIFSLALASVALLSSTGCSGMIWKPFQPIKYEDVGPHEAAFLIPLEGDSTKQVSLDNEEFLKKKLVRASRVQIPMQWRPLGYETWYYNGEWIPSALLIKVNMSPETREWTADKDSGTSQKNEAIWVMTSDQVEWSTGWTCTASIADKDDASRFLAKYKNGTLAEVMDREIRAKIQTTFGLAVTDLPMESLRKEATPVIQKTVKEVEGFFKERGITITNLGITGGFVYKKESIQETMVKVFNAEQDKVIAKSATDTQAEKNKKTQLEAEADSQKILTTKKAEAQGILAVAEARKKEAEVVADNPEVYMTLRRVELEKEKLQRWNGAFPSFFMGSGSEGKSPDFLLQVPAFAQPAPVKPQPPKTEDAAK